MSFKALCLHPSLVQAIREMHYTEPTPVQAEGIPAILASRDLIASAQTGTGKTAAYLLPILHGLLDLNRGTTRALIVTPTRELAKQTEDVFRKLARHTRLRVGVLVGGTAMPPQEKALRAGVDVLITTPGRLLDHMRRNQTRFDKIEVLVLDEADRMLDMGFLPDIKRIIARLPARRQTLLFSATMPPVIARLAKDILRDPVTIQIGRHSAPAVGITQAVYPVPERLKTALLRHLLRRTEMPSVLVFARTRRSAMTLARVIAADGFKVCSLHGDLTQLQRNRAMESFRRGACQVLVATNIAARGLDVEHITHVISCDVPTDPDDYVHRIGRTARMGAEGDAFMLASPADQKHLARIERQIGERLPRVILPDFDYSQAVSELAARPERHFQGRGAKPSRKTTAAKRDGMRSSPSPWHRSGKKPPAGRSRRSRH